MKIEIWSDFVCPFCYIGKRRLEAALEKFPHREEVKIEFKSFELDPTAKVDPDFTVYEMLAKKYGMPVEEAKRMSANVAKQAAEVGLTFNFDTAITTNTFDAHRLAKLAESKGVEKVVTERLMQAYFTDSEHIGDREYLKELGTSIGLEEAKIEEVLESDAYEKEVRFDQQEAREIGVQGVPFFVFNSKYAISGAQPGEVFLEALEKVWEEENGKPTLQAFESKKKSDTSYCSDDCCE
ncbi:DSBA-like thioredoxin domain protein [Bacillus sp. THAF10]|uniref:DsbA family oxidoreductase n=1 Tax=Bacillus sp. THAF10 TaxID=2587848 RepID=UPI0012680A6F|nr:DsbA family oxidoreductase [Bacillus sp. THAF10]QFT89147.1 DSBA-like thioredoxin domain protein [Bacillus sp. THAF10]